MKPTTTAIFIVVFLTTCIWVITASLDITSVSCSGNRECQPDECCVTYNRPIGKKRALTSFGGGVCEKLGSAGDTCYVAHQTPQDMNFKCPCVSGLVCKGKGFIDIPLGEVGTCA